MKGNKESKQHHWWPVGLQHYWKDSHGDVFWIDPSGKVFNKKVHKRNVGYKRYGHTMLRDSVWKTNFEDSFHIDNEARGIVEKIFNKFPSDFIISEGIHSNINLSPRNSRQFYQLEEKLHRNLLSLLFSLLIRSPAYRSKYGNSEFPSNEDIAKANMHQCFKVAEKLCDLGPISNQFFVFLFSPSKDFIFGDGLLDWLTGNLFTNQIQGKTLIPLAPELCVFFCTPMMMRPTPNCAVLKAEPWMVKKVNEITQIYSRKKLFFCGEAPEMTEEFLQDRFLDHKKQSEPFIDMLDEIAGIKKPDIRSLNAFQ